MNRCSEDLECLDLEDEQPLATLSSVQNDKMTLFFTELLDHDRDDVIADHDFDHFFDVSYQLHFNKICYEYLKHDKLYTIGELVGQRGALRAEPMP